MSRLSDSARQWVRHERARGILRDLVAALWAESIPVAPVKGVVLARTLYADVCERPIVDIDLRLRPRDAPAARRMLRARGVRIVRSSKQLGAFEIVLQGMLVELETSIGPPGTCAVSVDTFLGRATSTTDGLGFEHLALDLHDHALLLAVSAFKDKLAENVAAKNRTDLARLAALTAFDPARMAELAAEARLSTLVWIVARWVGSPAWLDVQGRIRPALLRPTYARVFERWTRGPETNGRIAAVLARAASDDPLRRLAALAGGAAGAAGWRMRRRSARQISRP